MDYHKFLESNIGSFIGKSKLIRLLIAKLYILQVKRREVKRREVRIVDIDLKRKDETMDDFAKRCKKENLGQLITYNL